MLEDIRTSYHHTILGTVTQGIPHFIRGLNDLVNFIAQNALKILVHIITLPLVIYQHPNLAALGFVCGFIFDKKVREIVQKVNLVYNVKRKFSENFMFYVGGGVLAVLTMPTSLVITALYYSSQWGAYVHQSSLAYHRKAQQAIAQQTPQTQTQQNPPVVISTVANSDATLTANDKNETLTETV